MSIQSLPDEILLLIITKCAHVFDTAQTALHPLLTVSRRFYRLVRPSLYHCVDLLLHTKSFASFDGIVMADSSLASLVHYLRLHNLPVHATEAHIYLGDNRRCALELIQKLPKLQRLYLGKNVELPKPAIHLAQRDFLPLLRHLTISTWTTAKDMHGLMRLPSLKYLTVTCGRRGDDGRSFALPTEDIRISVLRCLRFCRMLFSTSVLYQLLSMPHSLEKLSINFDEQYPPATFTLGSLLEALFTTRETLTDLRLACTTTKQRFIDDGSLLDLSTFPTLRTLRITSRFILGSGEQDTLIARRDLVKRLPRGLSELWVCTRSSVKLCFL